MRSLAPGASLAPVSQPGVVLKSKCPFTLDCLRAAPCGQQFELTLDGAAWPLCKSVGFEE